MAYYSAKEATGTLNINSEEVNNLEDFWTIIFVMLYLLFTPVFVVWYAQWFQIKISVILPILLLLLNLFFLPHFYKWLCGGIFIVFLRGSAPTLSIAYEYVLDIINTVSFNLRMNLQFSRVIIILITGFTFYLLWDEIKWPFDYLISLNNSFFFYIGELIMQIFQILAEIGHFMVIFLMQTTILNVMLIWLFHFLYVTFVKWWNKK